MNSIARYALLMNVVFVVIALVVPCFVLSQSKLATSDSIAYSLDLEGCVVTAQYRPTHYSQVLHDVQVINSETIEALGAVTLDDVIVLSPKIRLDEDPVLGTSVRMRGIGASNVAILVDGIPVIGRLDGAIDISQLSLQNAERIEIVDGPLSNIYGNSASAGVINIITKKTQLTRWDTKWAGQWESTGIRSLSANVGYQGSKGLSLSSYGRVFTYDKYTTSELRLVERTDLGNGNVLTQPVHPWNPKIQLGGGLRIGYRWKEDNVLSLKWDINNEEVTDYGHVQRPRFMPFARDGHYETERSDLALHFDSKILDEYYVDYSIGINTFRRRTSLVDYLIEEDRFSIFSEQLSRFDALFSRLNIARAVGENVDVMAGATVYAERGSGDRVLDVSRADSTARFGEWAVYTEVKIRPLEKMELALSGRLIRHSNYASRLTPALHARYSLGSYASLRASYAQGYRNPSLKELYLEFIDFNHHIIGAQDLEPELSHDLRISFDMESKSTWGLNMGIYRTYITNRISLVEYDRLRFSYDNVEDYNVYGAELGFMTNLGRLQLQSTAHLGYWSAEHRPNGERLYSEVFDMNHTLDYKLPRLGCAFIANYRFTGVQPNLSIGADDALIWRRSDSFSLLDVSVAKTAWKKRIKIVVGVRNVFDVQQIDTGGGSSGAAHASNAASRPVSLGRSLFLTTSLDL